MIMVAPYFTDRNRQSYQFQYKIKETLRPQIFFLISQRNYYYLKIQNIQGPYRVIDFNCKKTDNILVSKS